MPLPVVTAYFGCPIIRCYIIGSTAILPRPASLPACAASEIAHKSSRFPFLFDYLIIAFPFPTASAISSSTRARTASNSAAEAAQVEKVMGLPKTCSISETTRSFP